MTKLDLIRFIIDIHNRLLSVSVCGESTIVIADIIKDLRGLLVDMQRDPDLEKEHNEDEQQRGDLSG